MKNLCDIKLRNVERYAIYFHFIWFEISSFSASCQNTAKWKKSLSFEIPSVAALLFFIIMVSHENDIDTDKYMTRTHGRDFHFICLLFFRVAIGCSAVVNVSFLLFFIEFGRFVVWHVDKTWNVADNHLWQN